MNKEFSIIFALVGLIVLLSLNQGSVFGLDTVNDTFNIDTILSKNPYAFTDNDPLDLSNSDIVCPSNNCKTIPEFAGFAVLTIDEGASFMAMNGFFNLVDDMSNGKLGPKKQKLIEQMDFGFTCSFSDIREDPKNKTTKYICSRPDRDYFDIERKFNSTKYIYRFTASFELPSRHFVLNATEAHENLYPLIGHQVFRNETGQIVVK